MSRAARPFRILLNIASGGPRYSSQPRLHATWPDFWLWQYSDGANGPEVKTVDEASPCDCNAFNGSEADLRANWA